MSRRLWVMSMWMLASVASASWAQDTPPPAAAPELRVIEKEVAERWKNLPAFRAKLTLDIDLQASIGSAQHGTEGAFIHKKINGKDNYRQDLTTRHFSAADGAIVSESITSVADGTYLHSLNEKDGLFRGTKRMQKNSGIELGGQSLFDYMDDNYVLAALPDGDVDGHPAWVIEGTGITGRLKRKTVFYISKEWGLLLKREVKSLRPDAPNPDSLLTIFDVDTQSAVDDSLFVFQTPPGVRIKDKTRE